MCPHSNKTRRRDPLQESGDAWPRETMLHHMAYVEERRVTACEVVGGADGEGIVLDGHIEASEGHHFGAMSQVELVEGGFPEVSLGSSG
jgi:hypothetical protein